MGAEYLGRYSDNFSTAASTYASTSFYDDLAWGAAWLFRATNDTKYLTVRHLSPQNSPYPTLPYLNFFSSLYITYALSVVFARYQSLSSPACV